MLMSDRSLCPPPKSVSRVFGDWSRSLSSEGQSSPSLSTTYHDGRPRDSSLDPFLQTNCSVMSSCSCCGVSLVGRRGDDFCFRNTDFDPTCREPRFDGGFPLFQGSGGNGGGGGGSSSSDRVKDKIRKRMQAQIKRQCQYQHSFEFSLGQLGYIFSRNSTQFDT